MNFSLGKQLILVDCFQSINTSLDKLVNHSKDDFQYMGKMFSGELSKLVQQNFIFMNIWIALKNLIQVCQVKKNQPLTGKSSSDKNYEYVIKV